MRSCRVTMAQVAASLALAGAVFAAATASTSAGPSTTGERIRIGDVVSYEGLGTAQSWRVAGIYRSSAGDLGFGLRRGDDFVVVSPEEVHLRW